MSSIENTSLRWLFLNLNSYFASIEQELRRELRNKPVGVAPLLTNTTCCIFSTTIDYYLTKAQTVDLAVFSLKGERVAILVSGVEEAGNHRVSWQRVQALNGAPGNGIYFIRLMTDAGMMQQSIIYLK